MNIGYPDTKNKKGSSGPLLNIDKEKVKKAKQTLKDAKQAKREYRKSKPYKKYEAGKLQYENRSEFKASMAEERDGVKMRRKELQDARKNYRKNKRNTGSVGPLLKTNPPTKTNPPSVEEPAREALGGMISGPVRVGIGVKSKPKEGLKTTIKDNTRKKPRNYDRLKKKNQKKQNYRLYEEERVANKMAKKTARNEAKQVDKKNKAASKARIKQMKKAAKIKKLQNK